MSGAKRECATCQFFQKAQLKGHGWCTHPKRLNGSEVKLLHRGSELACRDAWDEDLWVFNEELRTTTSRSQYRGLSIRAAQPDDEISSVTDTDLVAKPPSATDDVVTHTAVRQIENDHNAAAIADQAERVRVMHNGPGFAIREARKRSLDRRVTTRPMIEPAPSVDIEPDATADGANLAMPKPEPVVRREIDPNSLRKFFGTNAANKDDLGPVTNSYDIALNRAAQIRGVSQRATLYGQTPRDPVPPIVTTQEQERATTFERVHQVIARTSPSTDSAESIVVPLEPDEPVFDLLPEIEPESIAQPVETHQYEPEPAFDDDLDDYEPLVAADADVVLDEAPRPTESPRQSWWRSMNFGRKRRYQPDVETWQDEPVEASPTSYLEDSIADDPWEEAEDQLAASWDDSYEDDDFLAAEAEEWTGDEPIYDDAWDDEPYRDDLAYAASDRDSAYAVTSEESWLEDEHYFPAAQPPSWRQERARLLAARHDAEPLPEPIRFERNDATQHIDEPKDDVIISPAPIQRKRPQYFEIDDPAGLEQFRAALFAGDRPSFTLDREPAGLSLEVPTSSRLPEYRDEEPPRQIRQQGETRRPAPELHSEAPQQRQRPAPARFGHPRDMFDQSFDIRDLMDEDDPPRSYAVSSSVSKSCATCRSFQATGANGEGRCMADWSRTYRQIVHADELACRSSIGDWWLANDASWIPPVDRLTPETPRTNRLLARAERASQDEAASERGVRTRKVV